MHISICVDGKALSRERVGRVPFKASEELRIFRI
jgi:hypothetical protein